MGPASCEAWSAIESPMSIVVIVNGERISLPANATVASLIERLGIQGAAAAEVNKQLVPKKDHEARELREGDEVQIVSLVGGG
jgi:sulfur carrier protein